MTATAIIKKLHPETPLARMTDEQLQRHIRTLFGVTQEAIELLAEAIKEARKRRMHMPEFSTGIGKRLVMVAEGTLSAELLFKFADEPAKVEALKGVPLAEQVKLARGELLSVVEEHSASPDGLRTVQKTLREMNTPQVKQVFNDGKKRSPDEQRKHRKLIQASQRKHRAAGSRNAASSVRVVADTATGEIVIGAYRLKLTALTGALKLLGYRLTRIQ